jgi:S-formylglutathione hydrolase
MSFEVLTEHACFGGVQGFYSHAQHDHRPADAAGCVPAAAGDAGPPVPALVYLAGLTCNGRDLCHQGRRAARGG